MRLGFLLDEDATEKLQVVAKFYGLEPQRLMVKSIDTMYETYKKIESENG